LRFQSSRLHARSPGHVPPSRINFALCKVYRVGKLISRREWNLNLVIIDSMLLAEAGQTLVSVLLTAYYLAFSSLQNRRCVFYTRIVFIAGIVGYIPRKVWLRRCRSMDWVCCTKSAGGRFE
jgi:hypothetical protein